MFDPERMLGQMLSGALGGAMGGRRGRRGAFSGNKAVVGVGLLGVAMAAWEHYSAQQKAAQHASIPSPPPQPLIGALAAPPPLSPPPPPPPAVGPAETRPVPMPDLRRQQALLLMRAMIAAAAADGAIDDEEQRAITQRAEALGDDAEALEFLRRELATPSTLEQLVAQAPKSMAEEVYAAALVAVSIDTEAERAWLARLAEELGLAGDRVSSLNAQFGAQ